MSRPGQRKADHPKTHALKAEMKRMDQVHSNALLHNRSNLSYEGASENQNLQRRLQQPIGKVREAAATETPVTALASFPLNAS